MSPVAVGRDGGNAGPRRRHPVGFITWFLLATGAVTAFLSVCQRQKTLDDLDGWQFHMRHAGKVLILSERADLLDVTVPGAEIVDARHEPDLASLASGTDAAAFADALRDEGYGAVVVDVTLDEAGTRAPIGAAARLARFRPGEQFTTLALRPEAGMFAPRKPPEIDIDVLAYLVRAVRLELDPRDGEGGLGAPPAAATAPSGRGGWDVSIELQGLVVREIDTKNARRIRRDFWVTGTGTSLLAASLDAAGRLAERWDREHAQINGPLDEAMDSMRIELHVMYGFALVEHEDLAGEPDAVRDFLGRVVARGIHGLSVNWTPPVDGRAQRRRGFRTRLPADAIYWSRPDASRALARLLKDAQLGDLESFSEHRFVTLDRYRTIHVTEEKPKGKIIRLHRGRRAHVSPPREAGSARQMLDLLALRLVSDQADDGSLKPSYYPVRDLVWVGGRPDASSVSIEHGLGTDALWVAARALNDPRLRDAAVLALGRSMGWLRICPGVELAKTSGRSTDSGLPSLGGMSESQILEWCGPVDDRSRPTAVSEWSSPGGDPAPVPDDIAFVVQGGTARTADSALLAIGLARHLRDPSLNLTERKRLESLLDALVRFLIYMQTPDGRFQSHFVLQDHPFWNQTDPRTDGLALMALARVRSDVERGTLEVESGEDLAETLVAGFAAQARLFEDLATTTPATETTCSGLALSVPWVVFAAWQAERSGGVDGATDAAMAGLDPLVTGCLLGPDSVTSPDLAGAYVYGLGTLPGVGDVLVAASAHRALGLVGPADPRRAELSRAADLGLLLASRLVIRPGHNDQWLPVPTSAYGGVSTDLATHRQRPSGSHAVVMLLSTVLD